MLSSSPGRRLRSLIFVIPVDGARRGRPVSFLVPVNQETACRANVAGTLPLSAQSSQDRGSHRPESRPCPASLAVPLLTAAVPVSAAAAEDTQDVAERRIAGVVFTVTTRCQPKFAVDIASKDDQGNQAKALG